MKRVITKKAAPIEFLWLGLYSFAAFSLELILGLFTNLLDLTLSRGMNALLTGLLWLAAAFMLWYYAKKKFSFDPFAEKHALNQAKLLAVGILILLVISGTWIGFKGFKPLVEYNGSAGGHLGNYLLQVFYYLGEAALITAAIAFGQQFCEQQFNLSHKLPLGGLFLALTWGGMHFFLQGVGGGLFTIYFSLLAGAIYVVCKKDPRWSYLFIAIAFIL